MLTLFGLSAWLAGLFYLGRVLWRDGAFETWSALFLAGVCVILLPSGYGGFQTFHYAEAFATPRPLAEALVLVAIAMAIQGRAAGSFLAIICGALVHPIVAVGGAAMVWVILVCMAWRWIWLGVFAIAIMLLAAFMEIGPFAYLLATAKSDWFELARIRNAYSFPTQWNNFGWMRLGFDVVVVGFLVWRARGLMQRLAIAALMTAAAALLFSIVAVDFLHNAFFMMLQPWRALWILHICAQLASAILFLQLIRRGDLAWLAISAFLFARLTLATLYISIPALILAALLAVLAFGWSDVVEKMRRSNYRLVALLAISLALSAISIFAVAEYSYLPEKLPVVLEHWPVLRSMYRMNILWLGLFIISLGYWMSCRHRVLAGGLVILLMSVTVMFWDQRGQENRYQDGSIKTDPPFGDQLAKNDLLFWPNEVITAWFLARRALYTTIAHGAATALFEKQALEFKKRTIAVVKFGGPLVQSKGMRQIVGWPNRSLREQASMTELCRAAPSLDKIVVEKKLPNAIASWQAPYIRNRDIHAGKLKSIFHRTYYLYDCGKMRISKP